MRARGRPGEIREESMGRRISRNRKPAVERVEPRELLSLVTDIMAVNHNAADQLAQGQGAAGGRLESQPRPPAGSASAQSATRPAVSSRAAIHTDSQTSIALPQNQGFLPPANPGYNLVLQPTGTATPGRGQAPALQGRLSRDLRHRSRAHSAARPCRSSSGAPERPVPCSTATSRCGWPWPPIPSLQTTGAAVIFDRNLNSNTVLGLDLATPRDECRQPRPAQPHHERDPGRQRQLGHL